MEKKTNGIYLIQNAMGNTRNRSDDNMLVSVHPIPSGDPNPHGAVLYTIKESTLKQSVDNIMGDFQGNAYIFDNSNDIIVTSQSDESRNVSDLKNILKDKVPSGEYEAQSGEYNYQGEKYFIATIPSTFNDWKIVSVVNVKEFGKAFFLQKMLFITLLSLLLLSGLIIAVFLGNRQYKPIQNLSNKFREKAILEPRNDELKLINHAVTNIFESNKALNTAVDLQKPYAREQILIKLLKGNIAHIQDYKSLFDLLNIKMYQRSYMVSILQLPSLNDGRDQIKLQDELMDYIKSLDIHLITVYAVDLLDDAIALIISTNYEMEEAFSKREDINVEISDNIYNHFRLRPNISAGMPYQDINYINRTYIEALAE